MVLGVLPSKGFESWVDHEGATRMLERRSTMYDSHVVPCVSWLQWSYRFLVTARRV